MNLICSDKVGPKEVMYSGIKFSAAYAGWLLLGQVEIRPMKAALQFNKPAEHIHWSSIFIVSYMRILNPVSLN